MGKKIPALLAEQKEKFIDGCVKNGVHQELAEKIFSFIEPFAGYGFNRSHAACYALIGYQTAYLKAHWPVEFMAALLTADQHDTDRVAIEIEECRNMGIKIMAPDLNQSFASFTVVTPNTAANTAATVDEPIDTIRFGLNAVKNVGEHIVEVIIKERKENGPYLDLFDFLRRITDKDLNKKSLESLIKCGALEAWGERGMLLSNCDKLLNFNKEVIKEKTSRQDSLFGSLSSADASVRLVLDNYPPARQEEKLAWEKELLGLYVSEHPFNIYKNRLIGYAAPLTDLDKRRGDRSVVTAGVISTIKKIITKNNESMLFVKVEDAVSAVELLIFPRLLKETTHIWISGKAVIVEAVISEKDQEIKLLVNHVGSLEIDDLGASIDNFKRTLLQKREASGANGNGWKRRDFRGSKESPVKQAPSSPAPVSVVTAPPLKIVFDTIPSAADLTELKQLLATHPGNSETLFKIKQPHKDNILKTGLRVNNSSVLTDLVQERFKGVLKIV